VGALPFRTRLWPVDQAPAKNAAGEPGALIEPVRARCRQSLGSYPEHRARAKAPEISVKQLGSDGCSVHSIVRYTHCADFLQPAPLSPMNCYSTQRWAQLKGASQLVRRPRLPQSCKPELTIAALISVPMEWVGCNEKKLGLVTEGIPGSRGNALAQGASIDRMLSRISFVVFQTNELQRWSA
jgi:hypothetical protein